MTEDEIRDKLYDTLVEAADYLLRWHPYTSDTERIKKMIDRLIADGVTFTEEDDLK